MRDRIFVRFVLATALGLGIGLPARAFTLTNVTAVWPEDLVNFQSGFVEATLFQVSSGGGQQLIWFGPEQNAGEGSSLTFRKRSPLPLTAELDQRFAVGTIQYKNFPVTTKGPIDVTLELTFSFSDFPTQSIQIPFEIDHTNDNVLDIGNCPEGSATICDDILALQGEEELILKNNQFGVTVFGFDRSPFDPEDNVAVTSFLGPENTNGPQIDLLIAITMIPEPSTVVLVGMALGGLWLGRRRALRAPSAR